MPTEPRQDTGDGQVFISYPRDGASGQRWAEDIERWLRERAVACFRDESALSHTSSVPRGIAAAIDNARLVLCVVSNATRASEWVDRELSLADRRKPRPVSVAQVLVDAQAPLPAIGANNLAVDFTVDEAAGWRALARAVGLPETAPEADRRALEEAYLRDSLRPNGGVFGRIERLFSEIGGEEEHFATLARLLGEDEPPLSAMHTSLRREGESRRRENVLDAFREYPRLAVLGLPGAGKTWALRRVGADLARRGLGGGAGLPLPVFVRLGEWLERLPETDAAAGNDAKASAEACAAADRSLRTLVEQALGAALAPHLAALDDEGRLALLFDGLNELPAQANAARREAVVRWVRRHAPQEGDTPAPLLLSCRKADFPHAIERDLDTLTLLPLEPVQVLGFVRRHLDQALGYNRAEAATDILFWHLVGGEQAGRLAEHWRACGRDRDHFLDTAAAATDDDADREPAWHSWDEGRRLHLLRDERSLLQLARRPFVLKQMIELFLVRNCSTELLSGNRLKLCERFVAEVLNREYVAIEKRISAQRGELPAERGLVSVVLKALAWALPGRTQGEPMAPDGGEPPPERGRVTVALQALAWALQGPTRGEPMAPDGSQTSLSIDDARVVVGAALGETGVDGANTDTVLEFVRDAQLVELTGSVRFIHQLYQEFFAAGGLEREVAAGREPATTLWPAEHWWRRSGWEEVARFVAIRHGDDPQWIIDRLADAQPLVLADCLREAGVGVLSASQRADLHHRWMPRLDQAREPRPEARHAVGLALGRLDLDDRAGIGLRADGAPDIEWCEVPAGEFIWQDGERRELPVFRMARYAVTNAQYAAFVEAGGYGEDRWWEGLAERIDSPREPSWSESNRPRTDVSWFEAMAYCRWLTSVLGYEVRLPVEPEWEKAARGPDGRAYPWGEEYIFGYANVDESETKEGPHYLQETTAVGIYPQGASEYGIEDLSGNVWEWCLNEHEKPEKAAREVDLADSARRALRGGSWLDLPGGARAAVRLGGFPGPRDLDIGFRLVCASPISEI